MKDAPVIADVKSSGSNRVDTDPDVYRLVDPLGGGGKRRVQAYLSNRLLYPSGQEKRNKAFPKQRLNASCLGATTVPLAWVFGSRITNHETRITAFVLWDPAAPIDFSVSYWQGLDAAVAGPYFAAMPGWQQTTIAGLQAGHRGNVVEIITHPLWNRDRSSPYLTAAHAQAVSGGNQVQFKSLFEVLRRPF